MLLRAGLEVLAEAEVGGDDAGALAEFAQQMMMRPLPDALNGRYPRYGAARSNSNLY